MNEISKFRNEPPLKPAMQLKIFLFHPNGENPLARGYANVIFVNKSFEHLTFFTLLMTSLVVG